jgi:alpha-mannosidase
LKSADPPAPAPVPAPVRQSDLERQPTLFLVYTVHLDTQWRWTVQDTIRDFIPATLEGNFALFEEHPERVLSFEGAFRYQLVEEYYPRDFQRLRELVRRGNWRPAGSMLDSPDVNCVAPESLLRHILYAQRFFRERLGTTSIDLFLPDCFGFGHALPTIAAHCGLQGFSAQKFGNWGSPAELPFDIGRWLGPDGNGVIAALRPEGYGEGLHEDLSRAERWRERIERQFAASGLQVALMYVGLGDRGGRLAEESLAWIDRSTGGDGPIRVVQAGSDALFRSLSEEQVEGLPEHRGELLLPTHGTGCWTSQAAAKRWNRACETRAGEAERAASVASWLGVMTYPAEQLREAWQRFLWHQMHDDLTGTSIPEAYRFTWNDQLISLNQFETVLDDALAASAAHLDTRGPGHPVVVFNPLERERCDLVEAEIEWPGAPLRVEAVGPDGDVLPVQVLEHNAEKMRFVFAPNLPSLGLSVWHLRPAGRAKDPSTALEVTHSVVSSELYSLTIDPAGDISSVVDRRTGAELLAAPLRLELLPDRSRRWPAWEIHHRDICSRPQPLGGRARLRVVESGPVRVVVEISRRFLGSIYRQHITLASGSAGERIEIENQIDWDTRGRLLKVALRQPGESEAIYGLGCGTIHRDVNTPAKYEVPGLWAAPATGGLALIAEGQSGWDHPDPQTLRLSLLRSPRVFRKFRHQGVQDHGRHLVRYALLPHRNPGDTDEHAIRFASPPRAFGVARHSGPLGKRVSLLEVSSGVTARAVKQRERGSELIVRLQESSGVAREGELLRAPAGALSIRRLNGCEEDLAPTGQEQGPVPAEAPSLHLPPFGLETLALDLAPPNATLDPPTCQSLPLAFDVRVTSAQGEPGSLLRRIPSELWPSTVRVGAVAFDLGPAGEENALSCRGQTLAWEGEASAMHLLAASTDRLRTALFRSGSATRSRAARLEIDAWDGIIGRWKGTRPGLGHRGWARPGGGFVRDHRIGWVATHLHDPDGKDVPYEYAYFFRYRIALEPGERTITLPELSPTLLFAVTLERAPSVAE